MTSAPDNDNQSALTSAYLIRLGKIAEAREAVVEAAKAWAGAHGISITIRAGLADALYVAVAALRAIEQETSNG